MNADDVRSTAAKGAERLRHTVDRFVNAAVHEGERVLSDLGWRDAAADWHPVYDVLETETSVVVRIDLPGVPTEAIDVNVLGNVLTVSGTRPEPTPIEGETLHVRKRPSGSFKATLSMPAPVDRDAVSARTADGVLEVELPKAASTQPRHVPISVQST